MTATIQLRQDGEPSDQRTAYESPDVGTQAICSVWLANQIAESLDSTFIEAEVSEEADVMADLDRTTKNYGVYETPGDAVTGLYVSHETLAEVFDMDEADPENAPESVGLSLAPSDSDSFEEAEDDAVDEDEIEALVASGGSDSEEDDESDEEEEVEIADEEVGLVDGE